MGLEPPALVVASLAKTAGTLTPEEFIAALRPLTGKSITASGGRGLLTAAATRAMGQLKSSRQAWQLDGLCKALRLDVGEVIPDDEIFEEDSRTRNVTGEKDLPAYHREQRHSRAFAFYGPVQKHIEDKLHSELRPQHLEDSLKGYEIDPK
eukprot:g8571.t1